MCDSRETGDDNDEGPATGEKDQRRSVLNGSGMMLR